MDRIVTLKERKAAEADRRRRAVGDLHSALGAYARQHGGRFLLFGSAARGDMRYDCDVDTLVDFPPDLLDDAWNFAERACWDRRLDPDIAVLLVQGPLSGAPDARSSGGGMISKVS
jgi:predicted nucleotidyltransferase